MSVHNIVEESYECYCMECGDIIKRKDGETEKEQEEWFIIDDELKLCSKCVQSTDEEEDERCFCCGTTCLDHTSNKGRGSESPCPICEEYRCSLCPCDCPDDELVEVNSICTSCGWEGKCCVDIKRKKELEEKGLMEENCFNSDCDEFTQ